MAAICAVGGLIFDLLDRLSRTNDAVPPLRQAAAAFVAIAAVSFVMTVEQRRWLWSLALRARLGRGGRARRLVHRQLQQQPDDLRIPVPVGRCSRCCSPRPCSRRCATRARGASLSPASRPRLDRRGDRRGGLVFTGITFLLAWLIAGLFDLIGIDADQGPAPGRAGSAGCSPGSRSARAVGLLRERDALVATLQRLVMVVLGVLAPVLAAALLLFLLSLPFTGLGELWESDIPATPMMLVAGRGCDPAGQCRHRQRRRRPRDEPRAARLRRCCSCWRVLPLAIIAALSLGQRIGQYGWTPERIWGVVAVAVAIAYGAAGWWAVVKGRSEFDELLRPLQTKLAIGLCGLALFLALPILDFGAISAESQMARLDAGRGRRPRNSTGGRWRSTSVPPAASGWPRSRAAARRRSASWPPRRWRPRTATTSRAEVDERRQRGDARSATACRARGQRFPPELAQRDRRDAPIAASSAASSSWSRPARAMRCRTDAA